MWTSGRCRQGNGRIPYDSTQGNKDRRCGTNPNILQFPTIPLTPTQLPQASNAAIKTITDTVPMDIDIEDPIIRLWQLCKISFEWPWKLKLGIENDRNSLSDTGDSRKLRARRPNRWIGRRQWRHVVLRSWW